MKILKNKKILDIRESKPSDAAEILEYLKSVGGETDNLLMDSEGIKLTVEQEEKYLEKCNKSKTSKSFVGIIDKKIVTVCGFNGSDKDRVKHNVELGMSVLKDYWNLGVGQHMFNYILAYVKTSGLIRNITLEVRSDNEAAIHIYKKFGFVEVGLYHNKIKIDDKFYDSLIMELPVK